MRSPFAVLFHMFLMLFYLGKDIIFFVHISRCAGAQFFIFFVRKFRVQVRNKKIETMRLNLSGRPFELTPPTFQKGAP